MKPADILIKQLKLLPHPEGGYYRRTFRHDEGPSGRGHMSAIYYLITGDKGPGKWHRLDAAEMWHWYAGAPLELSWRPSELQPPRTHILGNNFIDGQEPQCLVPTGYWQRARCLGDYTLAGCTVSPGFSFDHFTLAPSDCCLDILGPTP